MQHAHNIIKCVFAIIAPNKQFEKGNKQDTVWQQREIPLLVPNKIT